MPAEPPGHREQAGQDTAGPRGGSVTPGWGWDSSAPVNGPTPLPSRQLPLLLLETLSRSDSSGA